jgi:hypothetical protein
MAHWKNAMGEPAPAKRAFRLRFSQIKTSYAHAATRGYTCEPPAEAPEMHSRLHQRWHRSLGPLTATDGHLRQLLHRHPTIGPPTCVTAMWYPSSSPVLCSLDAGYPCRIGERYPLIRCHEDTSR